MRHMLSVFLLFFSLSVYGEEKLFLLEEEVQIPTSIYGISTKAVSGGSVVIFSKEESRFMKHCCRIEKEIAQKPLGSFPAMKPYTPVQDLFRKRRILLFAIDDHNPARGHIYFGRDKTTKMVGFIFIKEFDIGKQ